MSKKAPVVNKRPIGTTLRILAIAAISLHQVATLPERNIAFWIAFTAMTGAPLFIAFWWFAWAIDTGRLVRRHPLREGEHREYQVLCPQGCGYHSLGMRNQAEAHDDVRRHVWRDHGGMQ